MSRSSITRVSVLLAACVFALASGASAQPRIMPLGDSITQGGQDHASYRYELWFDLLQAGYVVDFVGSRDVVDGNDPPNAVWYPDYLTQFDRDHQGYWGWRTDQILSIIGGEAASAQPDIVLIHLGTNDIGQNGAQGVIDADANLRLIIPAIRAVNPSVVILLAQVTPIGPNSGYFPNAGQVAPLNSAIAQIASDLDTSQSPVVLVDQNSGFDLMTMMQSDDLHPNPAGEAQMANVWQASLTAFLTAGNPPPTIDLVAPPPGAGYSAPAEVVLAAAAADPNGNVVEVRFHADGGLLGIDASDPYEFTWSGVAAGNYSLTAVAEDDEGATTTSAPVAISVVPAGVGIPVAVSNASFESPVLSDSLLAPGPADFGGWVFSATPNTFLGIFNPPVGSYPAAGGDDPPTGADGANVAYLFNDGGPAESVEATQLLSETLQAGNDYALTVAIGRFLPNQPYSPSTYGGYRIELIAGTTVIAADSDTIDPPVGEFRDATASVAAGDVPAALLGQPLSIRLTISATDVDRSTHFDDVRLIRSIPAVPAMSRAVLWAVALLLVGVAARIPREEGRDRSSS
jgi:lysophospholipase L1-like esterase